MLKIVISALTQKKIDFSKIALTVLAIALQIQVTILANDTYHGLRLSLADTILPLLGIVALVLTIRKNAVLPRWIIPYGGGMLAGLLCVMTISLMQGHSTTGVWSFWALFNKYIGFWILIFYFVLGGWIVTNTKQYDKTLQLFITVFCGFFVTLLALTVILIFAQSVLHIEFSLPRNPWSGYMVNRNAYMVVAVFVMICIVIVQSNEKSFMPNWISALFWFLFPFFLMHNASRTGWIVMGLLALGFFLKHPILCFKKVSLPVIAGVVLLAFSFYGAGIISPQGRYQYRHFTNLINPPDIDVETGRPMMMYGGDQKRLIAYEDGMQLYTQSGNPLLGAGLGSYKPFQIEKRGEFIDVMDFTGLWLLVETGLLGLSAFSAFFALCLFVLYQRWREKKAYPIQVALLIFIPCFIGMSMLHELLYTRFLWFIMGLALAQSLYLPAAAQGGNLDSGRSENDDEQSGQEE